MRLHENIDFTTLTWVKPELDETLRQARQALEAYVEEGEDPAQLKACATFLHQVQGTLRMVELYAPAMVAEELEQLAVAVGKGEVAGPRITRSGFIEGKSPFSSQTGTLVSSEAEAIEAKIRAAEKAGRFTNNPQANVRDIAVVAVECGVITAAEFEKMKRRNMLRDIVVHVDDFPFDFNVATANKPTIERKAA